MYKVISDSRAQETKTKTLPSYFETSRNYSFFGGMIYIKITKVNCNNVGSYLQSRLGDEQAVLYELKRQQLKSLDEQQKIYADDLSRFSTELFLIHALKLFSGLWKTPKE